MIHFLMVKPKIEISETYVETTLVDLTNHRNGIKNLNIYEQLNRQWKAWVIVEDDTRYFLDLQMDTYNSIKHLSIKLEPQKVDDSIFDKNLYNLKLIIKNQFRKDWKECVWIVDEQSTRFAVELYGKIHIGENLLRQFINVVMIRKFGIDWWEIYAPFNLRDKYEKRYKEYKAVSPTFRNVSDRLIAIDTDDLLTIMKHKIKKLSIKNTTELEVSLDTLKERDEVVSLVSSYKSFINKIKNEMEVILDIWQEVFSNYFSEAFIDEWKRFCKNRNHIAHNKLIDLEAYEKIKENVKNIEENIQIARERFESELSDEEEQIEINAFEEEMEKERERLYQLQRIEEEAGVSIISRNEIFMKFHEKISTFIDDIADSIYFRNDIEVTKDELILDENEQEQELLHVSSKINNRELKVISAEDIDEEAGANSEYHLKVIIDDQEEICTLSYVNGGAEFDKELGYYLPLTYNDFYIEGIDDFESEVLQLIDEYFPNIKEEIDNAKYSAEKDGGNYPVADFSCEECGEDYVSIDELILEIGMCGNCGHKHDLEICLRCERYYDGNSEGNHGFCNSCYEYIESQ
ncbi:hypothetical protein FQP34_00190 [Peribacillus simplex]|uniref:Apea-like HEPN domain-containing protein n=1 Tax=Peribacillus simplex TaxID=1478 RepID=A0A8B5Y3M3_9BACI|nr:hypothetical protein [Peribacillus simplex]TVX83710.1 hypothetical protein FQP34_00190 [Peribacillus simplex]